MLDISCKDQFPSSFGTQPRLIKVHEEEKQTCTFISPINGTREEIMIPEMKGTKCFGCFGEWLLLIDKLPKECSFFNFVSYSKVNLPPFQEDVESIGKFSLTSTPNSPDCMITFVSFGGDFILFCHQKDKEWTKLLVPCFCEDNVHVRTNTGVNIIYKGWLFILSTARTVNVFDVASLIDGRIEETPSCALDPYPYALRMDMYLVESCNGLFLVAVHLFGEGQHVTHMEVYRLFEQFEEEDRKNDGFYWEYVSSIGDQAFFLSRMHGVSLCAREFGVEPNCIYATVSCSDGERLYKFCLDDQTYSFNVLLPEDIWNIDGPLFWTVPASRRKAIEFEAPSNVVELNKFRIDSVISEENQESNQLSRRWTDLPTELVELLFQGLSLVDSLRVATICQAWALTSQSIPEENAWPWLMHSPNISNGTCKFFDPICGKEYILEIDALSSDEQLVFHSSRDGWVVISEGNEAMFVLNPLTEEVIDLPSLDTYEYHCIALTGMPTSPDFRAFAFYFAYDDELVKVHSWCPGQQEWMKTIIPDIHTQFSGTINSPVLFDGELYCLDRRGQLGVFNPDNMIKWRVLSKPEPLYADVPDHAHACCALLEIQGDLVSVIRTDDTKAIQVFKLDRLKLAWSKMENLEDTTIFIGYRNSIAVPSPLKSSRNKIYLPKFESRDHTKGVFYSMDDHRYHPRFYGVEEPTSLVPT
ncbi:hypothetical protein LUZ63_019335 [Rhynchospora breviuscula]|uniref:KIB1-4 beta-propeller domain-containing protein n=1 Tax=Rhynchospora breviuscula TaxID=2022672 RepID=A0A9Q0HJL9_9POAL|nr:hypothetical protein LUZ63_019335 [Rhynchospora breviuscula]